MSEVLTVDGLTFDVRRSDRRKSLEIIVDRGGELRMAVPEGCATEAMAEFAREKRFWILTKLAEKESLRQPIGTKEFVAGEGFPYGQVRDETAIRWVLGRALARMHADPPPAWARRRCSST